MMLVLLTRPQRQSETLAQTLHVPYCIEPMLTVSPVPCAIDLSLYQNFIVTSLQVFETLYPLPDHGCYWCVGPITAERAREKGLKTIMTGPGTAEGLVDYILAHASCRKSPFLYLRGREITLSLKEVFHLHGFPVHEAIVYETTPKEEFTPLVQDHLRHHRISLIPFYSANSAKTFVHLIKKAHLMDKMHTITALVLSKKIAQALDSLPWKELLIKDTLANHVIEGYYNLTLSARRKL